MYHELFEEVRIRYNAKQRKDRQVMDYYEKIASGKQKKPFHEIILQMNITVRQSRQSGVA